MPSPFAVSGKIEKGDEGNMEAPEWLTAQLRKTTPKTICMREASIPFATHRRLALECHWAKLISHPIGDLLSGVRCPTTIHLPSSLEITVCPCRGLTEYTDGCRYVLLLRYVAMVGQER